MKKERVALTIRVSPELKFQIDKEAYKEDKTINAWMVDLIKKNIKAKKIG